MERKLGVRREYSCEVKEVISERQFREGQHWHLERPLGDVEDEPEKAPKWAWKRQVIWKEGKVEILGVGGEQAQQLRGQWPWRGAGINGTKQYSDKREEK